MDKEILNELKKITSKLDLILDSIKNKEGLTSHKSSAVSRGEDIRRQVQDQIAKARLEMGSKISNINFPMGNL